MTDIRNLRTIRLAAKAAAALAAGPQPLAAPPVEGQRVWHNEGGLGTVEQVYANGYALVQYDSGTRFTSANGNLCNPV